MIDRYCTISYLSHTPIKYKIKTMTFSWNTLEISTKYPSNTNERTMKYQSPLIPIKYSDPIVTTLWLINVAMEGHPFEVW